MLLRKEMLSVRLLCSRQTNQLWSWRESIFESIFESSGLLCKLSCPTSWEATEIRIYVGKKLEKSRQLPSHLNYHKIIEIKRVSLSYTNKFDKAFVYMYKPQNELFSRICQVDWKGCRLVLLLVLGSWNFAWNPLHIY